MTPRRLGCKGNNNRESRDLGSPLAKGKMLRFNEENEGKNMSFAKRNETDERTQVNKISFGADRQFSSMICVHSPEDRAECLGGVVPIKAGALEGGGGSL